MKTKSIVLTLCALLGFGISLSVMAASEKDDSFIVNGNVTLTESKTVGYLDIKAGSWLDLNGYDLIIQHGSETVSAVITNSSATLSHISFTPYESNGWGAQFGDGNGKTGQHLIFGGNLELTVCGIVNANNNWAAVGFQGAVNTHTGGTVLDGYGSNTSEDADPHPPRFTNTAFAGSGSLTLKNGAKIMFTGSENATFNFSQIIFAGGTDEAPNWIKSDRTITVTSPIVSENASDILHLTSDSNKAMLLTCDLSGVKGIIRTKAKSGGSIQFQQATAETMPANATLRLYIHDENTDSSIRYSGSGTEFCLGGLETDPSITEPNSHAMIQKTIEGDNVTLKVGSANRDNVFYGKIQRDNSSEKDWNVEKVGTGTWTLWGGDHNYQGTTTLTGGKMKFDGAGKLSSNTKVVFNGGVLGFGSSSSAAFASPIDASGAPFKVDADAGATATISSTLSDLSKGIVKTGEGMVKISNLNIKRGSSDTDVVTSDGYSVQFDEGTLGVGTLALDSGETIDLNGRNLAINAHTQTTASNGGSVLKNDAATLSTVTAYGTFPNKTLALQGNIRYVLTGSNQTHFRTKKETLDDAIVANTHTGGTVLSNLVNEVRAYNISTNCGTGPLVFACGGKLFIPSSTDDLMGDYGKIDNNIEVYGSGNVFHAEGANWGASFNLNGKFSGDGDIYFYNGWQPNFYFNSNQNDDFSGTLFLAYKEYSSKGYWIGESGNGFKNGTVCLTNMQSQALGGKAPYTHLYFNQNSQTDGKVYFGNLITDDAAPITHTNTQVIAKRSGGTTLYVGGKGSSGHFSGAFIEDGGNLAVVKEGAGTWTLDGTKPSTISGGITVNAGAIVLNTTLTGAVTVASGASFAGTVPSGGVTFESGALFDGDEATAITGDVNLAGTVVEVDDATSVTDGQVFLTVTGTATGKPSVSAALAAVEEYDGKRGKWGVRATTENGVTTYSLVWKPTAFVVVIR